MSKKKRFTIKSYKQKMDSGLANLLLSSLLTYIVDKRTEYDPYSGAVVGAGLFTCGLMFPPNGVPIAGLGLGMALYGFINAKRSARIYKNLHGHLVYVLAEDIIGKVYELKPYSTMTPYGIDGLAIPSFRRDAVFKVPDGVKVVITKEGDIKVLGPIAKIVTKWDGGWICEFDARRRGWLNDGHWEELFNKLKQY